MTSRIFGASILMMAMIGSGCSGDNGANGTDGTPGTPGIACWDLNESGVCDPAAEDVDGDGTCSASDCSGGGGPGTPGLACWDLDENGTCDVATEDADGDGTCSAADCFGNTLGTLSGTVTDASSDEVLADVVVTLEPGVPGSALSTDATGAFTGNIPAGAYTVTFELPGYATETVSAGVVAGLDTVLTIALTAYGDLVIPSHEEGCAVCHGPGRDQDVAAIHPDPAETLTITVTGITDTGGGLLRVAFSLTDEGGDGVTGITFGSNRFYISDIVPAGTATADWGTWDTDYLERWAYERVSSSKYTTITDCTTDAQCVTALGAGATCTGDTDTVDNVLCQVNYPAGTWTELTGGNYTYTFATALGSGLAMSEAPDYAASHTQRLVMRVDGRSAGYTRAVGIQDFTVSGAPALVDPVRVLAPANGCRNCHSPEMDRAAHGSSYQEPRACVMCHSPIGHYGDEMQHSGAWATNLFHKLHAAIPMDAFPTRIGGLGYGAVTFPQDVRNCESCHTGDEDMTDAWRTHPTVEACSSCHETISFVSPAPTGMTLHSGGAAVNGSCTGCHSGTIAPTVEEAHVVPIPTEDEPEFDVTLSITPPATGTFYVAGEAPMVTATLANADGSTFDTAFYTTARGAAGDTSDTALRVASVYIYGPRAMALPVLATGTSMDPLHDPRTAPTQGHMMFTGGTDALVETDATGFKYQLMAIPDDLEPGTYIVRVRFADYSRVASGDYHIESTARMAIQIGTATEEEKVAGDACVGCHGTENFLPHNERHSVEFDTDDCNGCHDQSGNHAIPIGNRVHAIHSANSDGDIYNIEGGARDWEEVTFPSNTNRCTACHTSGNDTYATNPYMMPCAGCHVETGNGALGHMQSNGGPFPRMPH